MILEEAVPEEAVLEEVTNSKPLIEHDERYNVKCP